MAAAKKVAAKKVAPKKKEELEPKLHVVTQEDLDENPEWVAAGIEVGNEIDLNSLNGDKSEDEGEDESEEDETEGVYVIVVPSKSEFIRVYEVKALAEEFVSKDASREIVAPETIKSLTVLYDVQTKDGVKHETKNFSLEDNEAALALCHENRGVVQYKTK